jgi:hypothetical protein
MGRPTIETSRVRRERSWRRNENVRIDIFSCDLDEMLKMNSDEKVVNMKVLGFFETNNFFVYNIFI